MIAPRLSAALAAYHEHAALWGREDALACYAAALELARPRPSIYVRGVVSRCGISLLPSRGAVYVDHREVFRGAGRKAWHTYSSCVRILMGAERAIARTFPRGIDKCIGCGTLVTDGTDFCDECADGMAALTLDDYCPPRGA